MDNIYDQLKPKIFETIAEQLKDTNNILEIGCGDCQLVNWLAKKTDTKVVGIDITNVNFGNAKKEAQRLNVAHLTNYIEGDAEKLSSVVNEKFDAIVSMYVLHELKRPVRVLKEARKVLRNGGKIVIIDFVKGSAAEKLWEENYYTFEEIELLLRSAGFNRIKNKLILGKELAFIIGM